MEMEEKTGDSDSEDKEFRGFGGRGNDLYVVYRTEEFEDGWISEVSEDYSYEKGSDEDYDPVGMMMLQSMRSMMMTI